jgi:hypothetical protein
MTLAAITQSPASPAPAAPPQQPLPEIKDIAPPVDVFPWPWWMVAIAIAVVLLIVGMMVWAMMRSAKRRPPPPPPLPRDIALRALEELRARVEHETPYAFSVAVSDTLRTYIGAQYGLHAREQTSPEFLADIAHSVKFSARDKDLLGRFLESCDLIKFARIDATAQNSRELLESAIAFVEGERVFQRASVER